MTRLKIGENAIGEIQLKTIYKNYQNYKLTYFLCKPQLFSLVYQIFVPTFREGPGLRNGIGTSYTKKKDEGNLEHSDIDMCILCMVWVENFYFIETNRSYDASWI